MAEETKNSGTCGHKRCNAAIPQRCARRSCQQPWIIGDIKCPRCGYGSHENNPAFEELCQRHYLLKRKAPGIAAIDGNFCPRCWQDHPRERLKNGKAVKAQTCMYLLFRDSFLKGSPYIAVDVLTDKQWTWVAAQCKTNPHSSRNEENWWMLGVLDKVNERRHNGSLRRFLQEAHLDQLLLSSPPKRGAKLGRTEKGMKLFFDVREFFYDIISGSVVVADPTEYPEF